MIRLADSHCHLDHIETDTSEVLDAAAEAGVAFVVDIGMGLTGSGRVAERAANDDRVFASVGIHPNDLSDFVSDEEGSIAALEDLSSRPGVVAIGETGLDFYRDRWTPDVQERAFRSQIDLARRADKTLVIHCRDAQDELLAVLDSAELPQRVVMHCFSGDVSYAKACADRGFFCSFAGNLTYKRNDELRAAAKVVPDDLLLVETDAPFLSPVPFRGKPNSPALVVHTAAVLAEVKEVPLEGLAVKLLANTNRAFVIITPDLG